MVHLKGFSPKYPYLTCGGNCMWSFFDSCHGKGLHDGGGIVLKGFIKQVQLDVEVPHFKM